jgi:hypothetical protein
MEEQAGTTSPLPESVPKQIFNNFIEKLADTEVPAEVISRFKVLLQQKANPTESEVRTALFSDSSNL